MKIAIVDDDANWREEIKQKVRKYKEEIVYYEAMIASGCKEEKAYLKIIDSLRRFIDKYAIYGSHDL